MRKRITTEGVIGLDLSLRAAAVVWIPMKWTGDTTVVQRATFGQKLLATASPRERVQRIVSIASQVASFCDARKRDGVKGVYVEDYAFGLAGTANASQLMELGGVVKAYLFAIDLVVIPVNISSGRKTLLQKLPRKGAKEFTERNVRRLKGEALYWNADEVDAVVVANQGIMLEGGTPLSFPGE